MVSKGGSEKRVLSGASCAKHAPCFLKHDLVLTRTLDGRQSWDSKPGLLLLSLANLPGIKTICITTELTD